MEPIELELALKKSTKGTHVYGDDDDGAPIPSIYIKKQALPANPPAKLKVVLNEKPD